MAVFFSEVPSGILSVAFHPHGRRIVSVGEDRMVRLWDIVTRQEILVFEESGGVLRQAAFSSHGHIAVAGAGTRDLSMHFGGVQAVRHVNFTLAEGELRCLIGPNGAGKSTFFKMLTGQLQPTHGHVLFRGRDISNAQPTRSRGSASASRPRCRACSMVSRCGRTSGSRRARMHSGEQARRLVDEMLERIGLTEAAERLVGQLAHGQRQWVELGLVLSTDPELILLDEPAAGMTHEEVYKTAELVREINRTKALIVVEHDMQFIRMIAKQVTVFNQGAVLVEDTVENIMRNPQVRDIYLGKQAAA